MRSRSASRGFRAFALAAVGACVAGAIAAASPDGTAASTATTKVTVGMVEYRFRLSQKTVHTGTVIFTVINRGQIPHTFEVQRLHAITPVLQPGHRSTLRVRFKKPGRYYYLCTVDNH
ncbi:MAG TPA: cupredoxin domain-containing protein, partial [Gaiellaceae bacterium]